MVKTNKRIDDRRVSNFDFRKHKENRRTICRRKIDKVNNSIYYVILCVLGAIMLSWLAVDVYFLMGGK